MPDPTPPIPPLLSLPRELRNLIYSYVDADQDSNWRRTILLAPYRLQYRIHNAPNLDLLHVHPRLRDEYLEAVSKGGISLTICDEKTVEDCLVSGTPPASPEYRKFNTLPLNTLLAQCIKHITIPFITSHDTRGGNSEVEACWDMIQRLISALLRKGPRLSTIRIGIQHHASTLLQHHNNTYPQFETSYFLPIPPACFEALPLVQRAEGYRLEQVLPQWGQPRLQHGCVKHGCYLYTRGGTDGKTFKWKPRDVVDLFWVQPYTVEHWSTPLPMSVIRLEMKEWREKHGHREAVAWF